jgi:hypothetical protein
VLFLRDLETGVEWPIFDGLDATCRRSGRTTACTRSTPGLPDGRSLVIWGEGRIWRVDAVSARRAELPRSRSACRWSRRVHEPLRYTQEVHPAEFDVRMLRT